MKFWSATAVLLLASLASLVGSEKLETTLEEDTAFWFRRLETAGSFSFPDSGMDSPTNDDYETGGIGKRPTTPTEFETGAIETSPAAAPSPTPGKGKGGKAGGKAGKKDAPSAPSTNVALQNGNAGKKDAPSAPSTNGALQNGKAGKKDAPSAPSTNAALQNGKAGKKSSAPVSAPVVAPIVEDADALENLSNDPAQSDDDGGSFFDWVKSLFGQDRRRNLRTDWY